MAKTAWVDASGDNYLLTVFDTSDLEYEALLYYYAGCCWCVEVTGGDPVPVAGRTLNEVKEDAESWLLDQGFTLLEIGCEYRDVR